MDSHKKFWLFVLLSACVSVAVVVTLGSLFWSKFTPDEQHQMIELVHRNMVYIVAIIAMFFGGWIVWLDAVLYTYVLPTVQIADETLIILTVNPSHRIKTDASRDMMRLAALINEGADRYEAMARSVEERVKEANEALKFERNILASVIEHLPEAMVICNASGMIVLYNQKAQQTLTVREPLETGRVAETLSGPFLGLGRHIGSVIDPRKIEAAMAEIAENLQAGKEAVSFFSIQGVADQLLNVEMAPIIASQRQIVGYILTCLDVNEAVSLEARRTAMQLFSVFRSDMERLKTSVETLLSVCRAAASQKSDLVLAIESNIAKLDGMIDASLCEYTEFQDVCPITLTSSSRPEFYDFDLFNRPDPGIDLGHQLLTNLVFTVFDTETTGLNPATDEIISIGAVRIVNNKIVQDDLFSMLVDPRREVSEASIRVHGIRPEILKGQPTIEAVLAHFQRYADNTVLVGHNVAFDMRMFQVKEPVTGIRFTQPVLDTMFLSAILHPAHRYHSIEAISNRLGICIRGRHTALGDAMATAEIFMKFLPLLARMNILTLNDAIEASKKSDYAKVRY